MRDAGGESFGSRREAQRRAIGLRPARRPKARAQDRR
jgi:hypothetical protein